MKSKPMYKCSDHCDTKFDGERESPNPSNFATPQAYSMICIANQCHALFITPQGEGL
jgi:hypothetical protein